LYPGQHHLNVDMAIEKASVERLGITNAETTYG